MRLTTDGYPVEMASEESSKDTPLLDQWIAEVGEDGVVLAVETARRAIAEGRLPGFSDKDELFENLQRRHPLSA